MFRVFRIQSLNALELGWMCCFLILIFLFCWTMHFNSAQYTVLHLFWMKSARSDLSDGWCQTGNQQANDHHEWHLRFFCWDRWVLDEGQRHTQYHSYHGFMVECPFLTRGHITACWEFAKRQPNDPPSKLILYHLTHVRRKPDTKHHLIGTIPAVKHWDESNILWGCFLWQRLED